MYRIGDNAWLELARGNIQEVKDRKLSETDTRRLVIEPVLAWMGYNIWAIGQVEAEVPIKYAGGKGGTGAVDYVLLKDGRPYVLVEAKSLGTVKDASSVDILVVKQLLGYCSDMTHRPRWGVITDGRYWLLYDEQAKVEAPLRVLLEVDLTRTSGETGLLRLISPASAGLLCEFADAFWKLFPSRMESWYGGALRGVQEEYRKKVAEVVGTQLTVDDKGASKPVDLVPLPPRKKRTSSKAEPSVESDDPGGKVSYTLGGVQRKANTWAMMFREVVRYAVEKGKPPIPYSPPWTKRVLLSNTEKDIQIRAYEIVPGVFVEMNWSSAHLRRLSHEIIEVAGLPAETLKV